MNETIYHPDPRIPKDSGILASDFARASALAQLVDQIPGQSHTGLADKLAVLLNQSALSAQANGLTDEAVDAEMAAHKAERGIHRR